METPFNLASAPQSWAQSGDSVTLVEGASFSICAQNGDITPGQAHGVFFRDRRVVSRWELYVDGHRIEPLSVQPSDPFAGVFVCRPRPRPGLADGTLVAVRRRLVGHGMREALSVRNFGAETAAVTITLVVEADFADLFAVKDGRAGAGGAQRVATDGGHLGIWPQERADDLGLVVRSDCGNPIVTPGSLTFQVVVDPGAEWHTCLEALPVGAGEELPPQVNCDESVEHTPAGRRLSAWREGAPRVRTGYPPLAKALQRTGADLGSLRIFDPARPDLPVIAAGAPWYMTLFGRDSLLTSWMSLPIDPQLAVGTLTVLAELQGAKAEPLSEEEPGRILHEVRHGCGFGAPVPGDSVYYGTADATPLFVMLVGELYRWGRADAVRPLLGNVDRALSWIAEHGDRDGDGFVEYRRRTDKGILNQGWKDSWDAISFADGRLAEAPIALCEVQGYVYAAYLARVEIALAEGDPTTAQLYTKLAADLKEAFNETFWLPDRGYLAVALDRDKRPVDSMTSNVGHCLWTGIVDEEKAGQLAERLLAPDMFTGWGLRTLSTESGRYNPVSYHNGSVWPHDSAIVAAGLARYGFVEPAQRLAIGLLEAAERFDGRLPELFCGFDRAEFASPVSYPSSCSPQAWAAAAPLLLVRALLGFEPDVPKGLLRVAPTIPARMGDVRVDGIPLAGGRVSVHGHGHRAEVTELPPGIELKLDPAAASWDVSDPAGGR